MAFITSFRYHALNHFGAIPLSQDLTINPHQISSIIFLQSCQVMPHPLKYSLLLLTVLTTNSLYGNGLDSLQTLLQEERFRANHQKEVELLIEIGQFQADNNDYERALTTFDEALPKAKKIKDWKSYQVILSKKGQALLLSSQFQAAIPVLTELVEEIESKKEGDLAFAYSQLAEAYKGAGVNELAYDYHLQALQLYEEKGDSLDIAGSLYNIGSIFFYQDNDEMALEYFKKVLRICTSVNSERYMFSAYCAIAGVYNRMKKTEESLHYNELANTLGLKLNLTTGLAYVAMNLGANHAELGDFDAALRHYERAQAMLRENNDSWGECGNLRLMGVALMEKGEYEKSLDYLKQSEAMMKKMGSRPRLLEVTRSLAAFHERVGDFEKANSYLKEYAALKDSLANEATLQKMSNSKSRYEILQKEKALALKDAKFITQQRTFLLLGIGVLFVGLWLMYRQNKFKTRNNLILADKNEQIKKQNDDLAKAYAIQKETNEKIKEQYQQLEQSNVELKRFAFIASHDLKEPLRSIGSYANLLQRRYHGKLDENANDFLNYITTSSKRLYTMLNDVLDYSKIKIDKKDRNITDANEAIQIVNDNLKNKIKRKKAKIQIGQLPKITADKLHLVQIFQNLIDNSLKYSEQSVPSIEINSREKNGFHEFSVKDNGIGIELEYQNKIFEMFKRLHGREKFEGNGIGLAICKKIVQEYGGDIWVESATGKGSTFYFTLPA